MTPTEKLQEIYDSEQNISLSWFWDSGIKVMIGDKINGIGPENTFNTVAEAVDWLYQETVGSTTKREAT